MVALCQCSTSSSTNIRNADVVVSVRDQKLGIYRAGQLVNSYKISTSKFGIGDRPGSNCTPLGKHEVVAKIGHGLPAGAVLKSRQWNGEVLRPNAPGRDPIVSRILWLAGCESSNRNAYNRFIYIHGTTEEFRLGTPASYGCIRMAAYDVIRVFNSVPIGATVVITRESLPRLEANAQAQASATPVKLPPLSPDSKPADPSRPALSLAHLPHSQGSSPAPVLVNKSSKPQAAAPAADTATAKPAATAATAPPPEKPKKRRLFGLLGSGDESAAAAPAAPSATAAARKETAKPAAAPATVAAAETKPAAPPRRRLFGLLSANEAPPAAPAAAPAPAASSQREKTQVGPPKVTKTTKKPAAAGAKPKSQAKPASTKKGKGKKTSTEA